MYRGLDVVKTRKVNVKHAQMAGSKIRLESTTLLVNPAHQVLTRTLPEMAVSTVLFLFQACGTTNLIHPLKITKRVLTFSVR
jgi:hypothetical protein